MARARGWFAATALYAVNIPLVAAVVSRWRGVSSTPQRAVASTFILRHHGVPHPHARGPLGLVALPLGGVVGPLAAIALYQRSVFHELAAIRLALTDPLTGRQPSALSREARSRTRRAEDKGIPLSVCILDIDNFRS